MNDPSLPPIGVEFEWFDRDRPGLLDVLIGLEEHMCVPVTDGVHLYVLTVGGRDTPGIPPVPAWLGRGLVANRVDIISRIARKYHVPPGMSLPGASPA